MRSKELVQSVSRTKGIILVITAAVLWAISGTLAQFLFQMQEFNPEWLVVIRLLFSGIILLGFAVIKEKKSIWAIWKNKADILGLLSFSILGTLTVQYTYFVAIQESNAATATVLQYLAPAMISAYVAIRALRFPTIKETIAVGLALLGTFLLVTKGNIHGLSISGKALVWGLSSAVSLAFYTLQPRNLLSKWGASIVVGWGLLIGGLCFSFIHQPWDFEGRWSLGAALAVIFIIVFGTVIAFRSYLESLKYVSASETSLLACVEPLSAAVFSVVWLDVMFGFEEWLGTVFILSTIIILSKQQPTN